MTVIANAEELAQHIRERIRAGELSPGEKLPSLADLIADLPISRGTAQRAIDKLKAEGLVESRHGAGNYVRDANERFVRKSPEDIVARDPAGDPRTVRRIDEVPAPWDIAQNFDVPEGETVLLRRTTVAHGDRVVQLEDAYFPVDLARGTPIGYHDPGEGGIYKRLAEKGAEVTVFHERVKARPANPDEAEQLHLKAGSTTVLELIRLALAGTRVVEVARVVLDASAYEVWFELSGKSTDTD